MTMRATKRKKLEDRGWKVGSANEFLDLSPDEVAYIEMKLALSSSLKMHRLKNNMSQVELAKAVKSSQSRIAKMEAGDPSVSIDLLMKSLLALGASPKELARTISMTSGAV
jgi:DNA-binding XRE family transcriptional regulator